MSALVEFLLGITSDMGYWGVFLLMSVESSFIPFPSEVVIPPAAYLASKGEMNIFLVVLFGTLGSLIGAWINYALARYLGRVIVFDLVSHKFAKYLLLSKAKVERAEKHFLDYGGITTFIGRLIPAIRQLISLPAGFSKMNFAAFTFYTTLGASFWVSVLAALGYYFGENEDLLMRYESGLKWVVLGVLVVGLGVLYFKLRKVKK